MKEILDIHAAQLLNLNVEYIAEKKHINCSKIDDNVLREKM
jgi:hypothetical protein